jgi:squalene synthase HpnC
MQSRGQAQGDEGQTDGDEGGDEIAHAYKILSVIAGDLDRAYGACEALARSHYENFPVASRLLPKAMRPHVAAVYAFARVADDIADEGVVPAAQRRARLAEWRDRLHRAAADPPVPAGDASTHDLIFAALGHSMRSLELPLTLFDDLLSAFGQDTTPMRYASWSDVLDYCRRSANPIGRLVLRIAGYRDEALERSSDALCTALQLTNFWQDFGRDWRAGRLYVPRDLMDARGASEAALAGGRLDAAWSRTIEQAVVFTRDRFAEGRAVCDGVGGRLRFELKVTWLGGSRILDRVERRRADLLDVRPTLGAADAPAILWRILRWRRTV